MLLAIRPGSLFWSNTLPVLPKSDSHIKPRKCDFEKPSVTFRYFVLLAITMGSLLLNNSPSDLQNYVFHNKPWKCCFEQHSVTFCYFALTAASKGSLLLDNTPSVLHKNRYLRASAKVHLWTTLRHFAHPDIKLSRWNWTLTFLTANSIAIEACR